MNEHVDYNHCIFQILFVKYYCYTILIFIINIFYMMLISLIGICCILTNSKLIKQTHKLDCNNPDYKFN